MKVTRMQCTKCNTIGFFIRNLKNKCMFCGAEIKAIETFEAPTQQIIVDGTPFHNTKLIDLQVYNRAGGRMTTVPIVWNGDEYVATLPGASVIRLGPCFEFENAERLIRKEINHPHM